MLFNSIEKYDEELNDIKDRMESMEKRIEKYPDCIG